MERERTLCPGEGGTLLTHDAGRDGAAPGIVMFQVLGVLVGLYTVYAVIHGEVYAHSGPLGRTVSRADSPQYFWAVIVIYAGLSVALMTIF